MAQRRPVGLTRDAGFQIGVRRTLPVAVEAAWERVSSGEGLARWLGAGAPAALAEGAVFTLDDGSECEVRVCRSGSHVRVAHAPEGSARPSLIQVRVIAASNGRATVAFHEEHLPSAAAREERRWWFAGVLDDWGGAG